MKMIEQHIQMLANLQAEHEVSADVLMPGYADLPPFLRALLIADGTVTRLLGAYFNETIVVATVAQEKFEMKLDLPLLQLAGGDEAFIRSVTLSGEATGIQYARAISLLNPMNIQPAVFRRLTDENVGMGEVLRNSLKGSYRRVLHISPRVGDQISRIYLVFLDGRPSIVICETFELDSFLGTRS